jgi:hypothetical protein
MTVSPLKRKLSRRKTLEGTFGNPSKLWQIFNLFSGRKIAIIVSSWCYKSLTCLSAGCEETRIWLAWLNYFQKCNQPRFHRALNLQLIRSAKIACKVDAYLYVPLCQPENTTCCKEVLSFSLFNLFNLSSTKGQFLNSCPTCWQYAHANATSIVGCVVVIGIFHWTSGHSTVPMIDTLGQIVWRSGCVCQTTIGVATISICSTSCWEPDLCEGFHSKLHSFPIGLKVGCILIFNMLSLDSKHEPIQMYNNQQLVLIEKAQ